MGNKPNWKTVHMKIHLRNHPFHWPMSILTAAILFAAAGTLRGAIITWGPAINITGDSDVVNTGSFAYSYSFSVHSATVNGVSFTTATQGSISSNVDVSGFFYSDTSDFTSTSPPFSALSGNYSNILVGALYVAAGGPYTVPVTLHNLSVGHQYAVQVWVNDPRGPYNSRNETVSSAGGNTVILDFSTQTSNNPGGPGQYTVGSFTADATNQTFTMTGNPPENVTELNALQVRDIGIQGLPVWVAIHPAGAGAMKLIFKGPAGSNYTLLTATNLTTAVTNWTQLPGGTGTFGSNNVTNLDSAATSLAKFYLIRSP
jgi:hypothetical protein